MKRDPADPQKHLVYRWEGRWRYFNERTLTRAQAVRCVRRLARWWKVPMPRVRFLVRGVREWSYLQGDVLALNYGQCNEAIVAHEMAHRVMDCWYGRRKVPHFHHGPEFMYVYLAMLNRLEVAPLVALTESARQEGIEWTPRLP